MDLERAAHIAESRNQRLRHWCPLFSDQVEPISAEHIKAASDRGAADRLLQECANAFRTHVRLLVTAETFTELERRLATLPPTPIDHAEFWRREWERLCLSSDD